MSDNGATFINGILQADLDRLPLAMAELRVLSNKVDDLFSRAAVETAIRVLRTIQIRAGIPDHGADTRPKAEHVFGANGLCPVDHDRPVKVKHVFGADGVCREDHGAGECGQARKRKARTLAAVLNS